MKLYNLYLEALEYAIATKAPSVPIIGRNVGIDSILNAIADISAITGYQPDKCELLMACI
jgi:hypothetical protein